MISRLLSGTLSQRSTARKLSRVASRFLPIECLEPRTLLSAAAGSSILPPALYSTPASVNTAPTVAQAISINNGQTVTGKTAAISALGADDHGESALKYTWSVTTAPSGGAATFNLNGTNAAKSATVTFNHAGTYTIAVKIVDASNLSVTSTKSVVVTATLTGLRLIASSQVVSPTTGLTISGVSQALTAQALDQFGNTMTLPTVTWSIPTTPTGVAQPAISTSGATSTITFSAAGAYKVTVQTGSDSTALTTSAPIVVSAALTSFRLTADGQVVSSSSLTVSGVSRALTVQGLDQFGNAVTSTPAVTWSIPTLPTGATRPTISASGANVTLTFSKAGTYAARVQTASGTAVSRILSLVVAPTLTTLRLTASSHTITPATGWTFSGIAQGLAAQGLDQFGNTMTTPALTWSFPTTPDGAAQPTISASGLNATVTFHAAGTYGLTVQAGSGSSAMTVNTTITVNQMITSIQNNSTTPVVVTGTTLQLAVPTFVDQFGIALSPTPALTWSVYSHPQGAPTVTLSTTAGVTTAAFGLAGSYMIDGCVTTNTNASFVDVITVKQAVTSFTVTPNTATVGQGCDQQFTAQAFDQFHHAMTGAAPTVTWSATAGTITTAGLFTAPSTGTTSTITAQNGSATGTAAVTLTAPGQLQTPALASLLATLDADGSINRADMMQILQSVANNGPVTTTEFSDLKLIVNEATALNMPSYVSVLAGDIVNGNAANATFQGHTLGNLAVGSSATQLNNLIGKWFMGTDLPTFCNTSLVYKTAAGSLFPHTPSHTDEVQGMLGDCYFISAMGTLADSNPLAVENMFIDNGDGTFTVRFYTGPYGVINNGSGAISAGFTNNAGTADYITVNRMLACGSTGVIAYADYQSNVSNTANSLWIPLAEKAYAQWNQTGKEGRDGTNAWASIQGGWMATVDAQVLGYNGTDYIMTTTSQQIAIAAIAAKQAVTIGTQDWTGTKYGLYADHAYAITAYNASTNTFTLYNPWGSNQPGQLTWAQLQSTCTQMAVCSTSGTVAIKGSVVHAGNISGSLSNQTSTSQSTSEPSACATPTPAAQVSSASSSGTARVPSTLITVAATHWQLDFNALPVTQFVVGLPSLCLIDATFATNDLLANA